MVTIELSKKDAVTLREVLESALSELRTEKVRTVKREYHAELAQRERLVGEIVGLIEKGEGETEGG